MASTNVKIMDSVTMKSSQPGCRMMKIRVHIRAAQQRKAIDVKVVTTAMIASGGAQPLMAILGLVNIQAEFVRPKRRGCHSTDRAASGRHHQMQH